MELIPGNEYTYTDITFNKHKVKFIKKNHESYTLQIELPSGKKIWVVPKQLSVN